MQSPRLVAVGPMAPDMANAALLQGHYPFVGSAQQMQHVQQLFQGQGVIYHPPGVQMSGKQTGTRSGVCASRHMAAEQRRRARINERLEALRSLVPHSARANTAAFLEEVYEYITALHKQLERLGGGPFATPGPSPPTAMLDPPNRAGHSAANQLSGTKRDRSASEDNDMQGASQGMEEMGASKNGFPSYIQAALMPSSLPGSPLFGAMTSPMAIPELSLRSMMTEGLRPVAQSQQAFAPNQQSLAPPQQAFASNQQSLAPPQQSLAPPQQAFAPSQHPPGPPQQQFAPSQQAFAPNQQSLAPPQQAFAPNQQQSLASPQQAFAPNQQQSLAPPQQAFAPNQQSLAPSQQAFAPSQQSLAPPQQAFAPNQHPPAPPQQAFAPNQQQSLAPPQQHYTPSQQGFGPGQLSQQLPQQLPQQVQGLRGAGNGFGSDTMANGAQRTVSPPPPVQEQGPAPQVGENKGIAPGPSEEIIENNSELLPSPQQDRELSADLDGTDGAATSQEDAAADGENATPRKRAKKSGPTVEMCGMKARNVQGVHRPIPMKPQT